ncbi:hypothetical protein QR98_0048950 [Sarcoptes scabiei]|uniref:Uncharacterized protein n=1 Tax=Sarcoptes scabiei TaxID=52283 RepID=A0A132A7M3_SARSC|nr:hypothetical protein QR98_0048950 [Sarcoptes scabiei]
MLKNELVKKKKEKLCSSVCVFFLVALSAVFFIQNKIHILHRNKKKDTQNRGRNDEKNVSCEKVKTMFAFDGWL